MNFKKETGIGEILIPKNVIVDIILRAIAEFDKTVKLGNYSKNTAKFAYKMGTGSDSSAVEISEGENGPDIKVYIMVKFGTSISKVTKDLIHSIHDEVLKALGVAPSSVALAITGIISQGVAKRNIEVMEKQVNHEIEQ